MVTLVLLVREYSITTRIKTFFARVFYQIFESGREYVVSLS